MKELRNLDSFDMDHLFEASEFDTIGPARAKTAVSFSNRGLDKRRTVTYDFDAEFACARCLCVVPYHLSSSFECELTGEDEELKAMLEELLLQEITMELPRRHLCDEACKGLCRCGANLNSETCRCTEDRIDPRLELLKSLIK
ncbi:MAG: DUF177 domain-containing protein [Bacillota bacterium]|nr:DUF177 domain-containing protein [Bacillota bacterium]